MVERHMALGSNRNHNVAERSRVRARLVTAEEIFNGQYRLFLGILLYIKHHARPRDRDAEHVLIRLAFSKVHQCALVSSAICEIDLGPESD